MSKHTISDLYQMQSLPLSAKVRMTEYRIREWVETYGEDGAYVSFSGGKDSTVLLHIARQLFPGIKAVFVDTGLEYPEIRQFVKGFDNVDWLKPKLTFKQVIEKYGYPFISKEVSECVAGARKYLTSLNAEKHDSTDRQTDRQPYAQFYRKMQGIGEYRGAKPYQFEYNKLFGLGKYAPTDSGGADNKYRKLRGLGEYSRQSKDSFRSDDEGEYP